MSFFTPRLPAIRVRRSSLSRLLLASLFVLLGTACANPDSPPSEAYEEGEGVVIEDSGVPLAQRVLIGAFTYGGVWQGMAPVLDLEAELPVEGRSFRSKAKWTPWEGERLRGWPRVTMVGGVLAFERGALAPA